MAMSGDGPLVERVAFVLYPDEPDEGWLHWAVSELAPLWGGPCHMGVPVPFDTTGYYRDIAPRLLRRLLVFPGLVGAGGLAGWKIQSCEVEARSRRPVRAVNVDPGWVDGARLILASTKDHAHRIWLRDGIYAEVTLTYRFGQWTSYAHTFPDIKSGAYDADLSAARRLWLEERRAARR